MKGARSIVKIVNLKDKIKKNRSAMRTCKAYHVTDARLARTKKQINPIVPLCGYTPFV